MVATTTSTPVQTFSTQQYLRVAQQADTRRDAGFNQGPFGPDGRVSRQELESFNQHVDQQLQMVDLLGNFLGALMGESVTRVFDQLKASLTEQKTISTIMLDNFERFSNNSSSGITQTTIRSVASSDGNADDISHEDITAEPDPPATGGQTPTGLQGILELLLRLLGQS